MTVRTRFAPSPTGFLHIGGARTALFSWAYARRHGGSFILRIEDTDVARSTPEAVQAILDGMQWLGLAHDEGPFYQMQRMDRYKAGDCRDAGGRHGLSLLHVEGGTRCLRAEQEARKEKPRYDGRWRPEAGKTLPRRPAGVPPVVRFRNPWLAWWPGRTWSRAASNSPTPSSTTSSSPAPTARRPTTSASWSTIATCRSPMSFAATTTSTIRRARSTCCRRWVRRSRYAHLSMILGDDGQKLSKRHGAVSVMQYDDEGYLPEAVLNYLARLGWSHGDDEVFSMEQFVQWFDLDHITASAAQFNTEKLNWLNAHYLKQADPQRLAAKQGAAWRSGRDQLRGWPGSEPRGALYRDRVGQPQRTGRRHASLLACPNRPTRTACAQHLTEAALKGAGALRERLSDCPWQAADLGQAVKQTATAAGLKMPQLAIPLRVALLGLPQSPSIDAVLEVLGRERVIARLARVSGADRLPGH
jgi:glutamyl-tRNA synthetase